MKRLALGATGRVLAASGLLASFFCLLPCSASARGAGESAWSGPPAKEIVSLPMFAELTDEQVDTVVAAVKEIVG